MLDNLVARTSPAQQKQESISPRKLQKKVGKAILKKVPIIGWVLIGADVITLGPKGAFNEAVWPISELWGGGGA